MEARWNAADLLAAFGRHISGSSHPRRSSSLFLQSQLFDIALTLIMI